MTAGGYEPQATRPRSDMYDPSGVAIGDTSGGSYFPIMTLFYFETLRDRLPLKISSDRLQTLPKHVSDDPRHFIC